MNVNDAISIINLEAPEDLDLCNVVDWYLGSCAGKRIDQGNIILDLIEGKEILPLRFSRAQDDFSFMFSLKKNGFVCTPEISKDIFSNVFTTQQFKKTVYMIGVYLVGNGRLSDGEYSVLEGYFEYVNRSPKNLHRLLDVVSKRAFGNKQRVVSEVLLHEDVVYNSVSNTGLAEKHVKAILDYIKRGDISTCLESYPGVAIFNIRDRLAVDGVYTGLSLFVYMVMYMYAYHTIRRQQEYTIDAITTYVNKYK